MRHAISHRLSPQPAGGGKQAGRKAENGAIEQGPARAFSGADLPTDSHNVPFCVLVPQRTMPPRFTHRTKKAGLTFDVGQVEQSFQRVVDNEYITEYALVYTTSVLEAITRAIIERAGNIAHEFNHKRLESFHIQLAIRTDAPLNTLVKETYADEPRHEMLPPALPVPSVPKLSESGGEL
ncbi:uncharacterized protein SCHCODRAFT_02667920 [Schizophyllum commune H4-8]|nr:uncharacterized protein SCHCODRAFT_02667920 [Schizophyllum commune H4-8]KAI5892461.1 hypothetical protein SCHCODRAFT_02667920 [Schizophyllum commune H4-8]